MRLTRHLKIEAKTSIFAKRRSTGMVDMWRPRAVSFDVACSPSTAPRSMSVRHAESICSTFGGSMALLRNWTKRKNDGQSSRERRRQEGEETNGFDVFLLSHGLDLEEESF